MVRASTRSKTVASVAAAKPKPASPKKAAQVQASAKAVVAKSKPKPPPKAKPSPRRPSRVSARGRKADGPAPDEPEADQMDETTEDVHVPEGGVSDGGEVLEVADSHDNDPPAPEQPDEPAKVEEELKTPVAATDVDEKTWCICNGTDDGSPMITCEGCENWYHFRCMSITPSEADDIGVYICPKCHEETGKSSTMKWEIISDDDREPKLDEPDESRPEPQSDVEVAREASSATDGASSEDEYVDEYRKAKQNQRTRSSRLPARSSSASRSPSPSPPVSPSTRRRKPSTRLIDSGRSAKFLKRKSAPGGTAASDERDHHPKRPKPEKRKSTAEKMESAEDDPMRKYCLGKLREVVTPIFVQYHASVAAAAPPADGDGDVVPPPQPVPELDEDKRREVGEQASAFVDELERCVFEAYSEPDKRGKRVTGAKYKERFRMLTFNLEKSDRTELRARIASGRLAPSELSRMSSTDLANEKIQQEVESARLASLKDSILEMRVLAPRAKITHKGEQMIEDDSGVNVVEDLKSMEERVVGRRDHEEMQEREDDEEGGPSGDGSELPPQSPVVESFQQPQSPLGTTDLPSAPAAGFDISDFLGDMGLPSETIPASPSTSLFKPTPITIPASFSGPTSATARSASMSSANAVLANALLSASQSTPSFDLASVWGQKETDMMSAPVIVEDPETIAVPDPERPEEDIGDGDFDMFFDRGEMFEPADEEDAMDVVVADASGGAELANVDGGAAYEALPIVWAGDVLMPIDLGTAWKTAVKARQIGGRTLGTAEYVWRRLFTQPSARIDGRVPTENSTKYLVDTRLNPSKELIAVAMTPSNRDDHEFTRLSEFLIGKKRHALVFPWAGMPADQAIGKDFYLVPLKPEDPIPEFIELLDEVHLPKTRTQSMLLGIFVLQKGRLTTSPPQPPTPLLPPPPTPSMVQPPPPPPPTAVPPLPSSLAALLPNGLTEQSKSLLQSLMASGGISAVTNSLASLQRGPPMMPPQSSVQMGYGSPHAGPSHPAHSPPHSQYPHTPAYTPTMTQPHGLPPPMGHMGYAPPPPPPVAIPMYSSAGPSSAPSYPAAGPPVHPSRQANIIRRNGYGRSPSPEQRRYGSGDHGRPRGGPDRGPARRFSDDRSPPRDSDWRRDGGFGGGRGGRGGRDGDGPGDRGWRGRGRGRGGW